MIRNAEIWEEWEREAIRSEPIDLKRNLALLEAMYDYARVIGAFPPANPLEGLETKIKLARVLSASTSARTDRSGS
jgi:hypothetical protein